MIAWLLNLFAEADEVAELRDRAVCDAATIDHLLFGAEVDALEISSLKARIAAMRKHPSNHDTKDTTP